MHCPWGHLPATGFCEAALCAWIREPANTWSNVGYLVVGVWMWRRAGGGGLRILAAAALLTGAGSALYHATGTRWAGWTDQLGMFLGTGAMTALNVRRWLVVPWPAVYAVFGGVSLSFFGAAVAFPGAARWIYALGGPCCLIELGLFFRDGRRTRYRDYLLAWAAVGVAALFWWLDGERILCDPDNHILGGHALWHLFSAAGFYFLFRFYGQFGSLIAGGQGEPEERFDRS